MDYSFSVTFKQGLRHSGCKHGAVRAGVRLKFDATAQRTVRRKIIQTRPPNLLMSCKKSEIWNGGRLMKAHAKFSLILIVILALVAVGSVAAQDAIPADSPALCAGGTVSG